MFLGIEDGTVNDHALWKRRIEEGGVLNLRIARRKKTKSFLFGLTGAQQKPLVQTVDRDDFPYIGEELSLLSF